jgi:hypothetical protein
MHACLAENLCTYAVLNNTSKYLLQIFGTRGQCITLRCHKNLHSFVQESASLN